MIKILAETKGSFQLMDIAESQLLPAHRPAVVVSSNLIQDRIGRNQVKVLGELKSEASDEDFAEYLREADGEHQLAIDSFLAEFGANAVEEKASTSSKRGSQGRRAKARKAETSTEGTDAE